MVYTQRAQAQSTKVPIRFLNAVKEDVGALSRYMRKSSHASRSADVSLISEMEGSLGSFLNGLEGRWRSTADGLQARLGRVVLFTSLIFFL